MERAFGVLQAKYAICKGPSRLWKHEDLKYIMDCIVILHKMGIRYERTGELADLEASISAFQQAVQTTPPDLPDWPGQLTNLGNGLGLRYGRTGELADLEAACINLVWRDGKFLWRDADFGDYLLRLAQPPSAETCTTTKVRFSPEWSSGAVSRNTRATSSSASAEL